MSEVAPEPTTAPETPEPEAAPATGEADAALGPAGEKALSEWKQRAKEAERLTKTQAARLKEIEDREKSDLDKLTEANAAAESRITALTQRAVQAEVKALAASKFADPSDASAFLDLGDYVDDDGDIDSKGIEKALADLLKAKPHLGREGAAPSFDGGARTTAAGPASMNDLIRQQAGA